jgi:hypothetical protein
MSLSRRVNYWLFPAVCSMRSGAGWPDARIAEITSDNALTFARRDHDTSILDSGEP